MDNIQEFFKERGFAVQSDQNITPPALEDTSFLDGLPEVKPLNNQLTAIQTKQVDFMKKSIQQQALKLSAFDKLQISNNSTKSILGTLKDSRVNTTDFDVELDEVYKRLNDGTYVAKFENYISGTDNEERLASAQSAWEQTLNGIQKGIAKTALNILDGTVGTVVGLVNGISEGSLSAVYNNGFSKFIDDLNTEMDFELPNYYTQEQKNMGFVESLGTANFWANDFLGGMSFMLGTIGSEAIWAFATGGASLATALPKLALKTGAKGVLKTAGKQSAKNFYKNSLKLLKAYNRTIPVSKGAQIFNNARFLYTSAGYEAGVEARHSLNESLESFVGSYQQTFGRKPNAGEYAEFMDGALENSNKVFAANVALVGASNIAQFGGYFGVGTGLNKAITKSIGKRFGLGVVKTLDDSGKIVYEALKPNRLQRITGKTLDVLKAPFVEGFIEEGGQSVISKTSQNWLASRYNPNALRENFTAIDAATQAFAETYGTKEGFKEIGLGMLIGFVGGAGRRGSQGQRTPFGVGQFGSQVIQNENISESLNKANTELSSVQKALLDRLVMTNQFNTFTAKSKEEADKGNVFQASIDWDTAQYSKLLIEKSADMLDESVEDFKRVIDNTPNSELKQEYNLTDEQIGEYKTALVDNYTENVELFKQSSEIAEAVNPNGLGLNTAKRDYTQELGLNIFLGTKALQRANDLTESIDEFIGSEGTGSALRLYTNLSKKAQRRAEKIVGIERELSELENEFSLLQTSFTSTNANVETRKEDNQGVAKAIDKNEIKRNKLQEKLTKKRLELENLEGQLENRFYKSKFAFGGNLDIFKTNDTNEQFITDEDLKNSVVELEKLDTYKELLGQQNPEALKNLNMLIEDYLKNVKAFRDFNLVYERMADPRFARESYKGITKLFKGRGVDFNDQDLADSPLDVRTDALENYLNNNPNISQDDKFTVETLHRMSTAFYLNLKVNDTSGSTETVSNEDYEQYIEQNEVSDTIIDNIANKMVSNPNKPQLTKRETEIFTNNTSKIENRLREIKLQEGDSLVEVATTQEILEDENTLVGRLKNIINRVKNSNNYLNDFNIEEFDTNQKPTNKDYKTYDTLFKQKNEGKLTPKKSEQFNVLKQKINNWGKLEGTLTSTNATLSDLLEQVALIESQQFNEDSTLPSVTDLNDFLDTKEFSPTSKNGNYDNLQSYDKALVTRDSFGKFAISNINLNGILNILDSDLGIFVERKGKELTKTKDAWDIKNLKEGQRFTVKFEQNGEVDKITMAIGKGNNIVLSSSSKDKLNSVSSLKIYPSNNLPTNFQPLLREVENNGETMLIPVDTNFTFDNGIQMDNEAIFKLRQDDLVFLEIPTRDEFNKKLLSDYNSASEIDKPKMLKELENSINIYIKDKKNNFVGVHKSSANVQVANDSNLTALQKIRKVAVKRLLDENYLENQVIDVAMSIPVSKVYQGHPNFNIVKENGKVFVKNIEFTDESLESVRDVGYILDGKVVLKEGTKGASTYPFSESVIRSKRYKGKKVPVVVVEFQGEKLVYPITLKPVGTDVSQQLDNIIDTNLAIQDKILALNNLLITYDIDIDKNGFTFDNFNQRHLTEVKELLKQSRDYPDVTNWISSRSTVNDLLKQQATINVDLTNKPFHSPKIKTKITEVNGLDSEFIVDMGVQEVLPNDLESEIVNVQREDC